jgi:hypothetical protein
VIVERPSRLHISTDATDGMFGRPFDPLLTTHYPLVGWVGGYMPSMIALKVALGRMALSAMASSGLK